MAPTDRTFCLFGRLFLAALLGGATVGCGGRGAYPVRGKIVFQGSTEAAKELAGYTVTLVSKDLPGPKVSATGVVEPDGTFRLSTFGREDGAVAGKHLVAITPPVQLADGPTLPPLIDERYSAPETSGLEVTVQPGRNEVTLTVARAKPAQAVKAETPK